LPGSSRYFMGSVVAYSNNIKEKILGVSAESLTKYGAVSEQVVSEMAAGALRHFGTDILLQHQELQGRTGEPGKNQ